LIVRFGGVRQGARRTIRARPTPVVVSIFKWMRCNGLNTLRPVGCKHSDGIKALGGAENRVEVTGLALVS
jgi:hypothetical protein